MERRSADLTRMTTDWGKKTISIGEEMREQISTAVTDFGRKVADSIVHWKGLGNAVKEFFSSLAESTLRIVWNGSSARCRSSWARSSTLSPRTWSGAGASRQAPPRQAHRPAPGETSWEQPAPDCPTGLRRQRLRLKQGRASRTSLRREIRSFRSIRRSSTHRHRPLQDLSARRSTW